MTLSRWKFGGLAAVALLCVVYSPPRAWAAEDPGHGVAATSHDANAHTDAAHHDDTAGHGEKANLFEGGIGNIIITTIVFLVVAYILGKKAWPPLLGLLNERERSIREALEHAQRERMEAERVMHEYKAQLDQARVQATAIVEEGRRDADVMRQRMQKETHEETNRMIARARSEIQLATDTAVKQLYDQSAGLAMGVASGILQRQLQMSPEDQRALVQRSLDEMSAAKRAKLN